jgi:hypothetical protein
MNDNGHLAAAAAVDVSDDEVQKHYTGKVYLSHRVRLIPEFYIMIVIETTTKLVQCLPITEIQSHATSMIEIFKSNKLNNSNLSSIVIDAINSMLSLHKF